MDKELAFQNSCQVVPNCDQASDIPLNTPDIMSAQLSFDDLFYTPGPELEQKLLGGNQQEILQAPPQTIPVSLYSDIQIKREPGLYLPTDGPSRLENPISSCMEEDRRLSLDSLSSSASSYNVKIERDEELRCGLSSKDQNPSLPNSPGIFPELDHSSLEIYRDLILHHLVQDIGTTCSKLRIPTSK